jgi:hypothetical protein
MRCQVRSGTDSPCPRSASVEILGVPFCEQCAREQQACLAIGENTRTPRDGGARMTSGWHDTKVLSSATLRGPSQRPRSTATTIRKALVLSIAVSASVLASAACGGSQQPVGDSATTEQRTAVRNPGPHEPENVAVVAGAMARAGDAEARAGDGAVARAGDARASTRDAVVSGGGETGKKDESEDRTRKVTLKVAGDQGTSFSGVCSVGGHEEVLEGRVPERYAYELDGAKLECEIRKEGAGALEVVVTGEGVHSMQRTNAQGSTLRFVLSGGSISSSTSSVSQNQTIESSHQSVSDDSP